MSGFSKAGPHLRRLRERGSASAVAEACLREARLRGGARVMDLRLARAARGSGAVVVGPFLGEIGFELLYWIPFVRRLVRRHGIDPDRVTAISRGGAEPWYRGIATSYIDALDCFEPEEFGARLAGRREETGDRKQLTAAGLDREIVAAAEVRLDQTAAVLHPSLLFTRLRYFWAGERDIAVAARQLEFERLTPPAGDGEILDGVPRDYVAVKAYFSDCLPESASSREFVGDLVTRLAESVDVVVLPSGFRFDDHRGHTAAPAPAVHVLDDRISARHNLEIQTRVIAGARTLFATYGGFSYLAPLLGVDARAFYSRDNFNPTHRSVLELANSQLAGADYRVTDISSTSAATFAADPIAANTTG